MARNFNRQVFTVDLPSSRDVNYQFFTHSNWKGLSDDENYLGVDQETFSSCDNVYVNSEGLLASRPALKIRTVTVNGETLSDVDEAWQFDDVKVYRSGTRLIFDNANFDNALQQACSENIKLVVVERKIFVFAADSFNYYDMVTHEYLTADDFIYIPTVSNVYNNVVTDMEPKNELTSSYAIRRLFDDTASINYDLLVGKNIEILLDDVKYKFTFKKGQQYTFVKKMLDFSSETISDLILGEGANDIPFIEISKVENMLLSTVTVTDAQYSPKVDWTIRYSSDGLTFSEVPKILGVIGKPFITEDGNHAIVFKSDGPYAHSLVDTKDDKVFAQWTNLLEFLDRSTYNNWSLNLNEVPERSLKFNQSVQVNGHFITCDNFTFVYGAEPIQGAYNTPHYREFYQVTSSFGNIKKEKLYGTAKGTVISTMTQFGTVNLIPPGDVGDKDEKSGSISVPYTEVMLSNGKRLQYKIEGTWKLALNNPSVIQYPRAEFSSTGTITVKDGSKILTDATFNISSVNAENYPTVDFYTSADEYIQFHIVGKKPSYGGVAVDYTLSYGVHLSYEFPDNVDGDYYKYTTDYMPLVYCRTNNDFVESIVGYNYLEGDSLYREYYYLKSSANPRRLLYENSIPQGRALIKDALYVDATTISVIRVSVNKKIVSRKFTDKTNFAKYEDVELSSEGDINFRIILDETNGHVFTNEYMYSFYLTSLAINPIPLLFKAVPVFFSKSLYVANILSYSLYSSSDVKIYVDDLVKGENHYILPEHVTELSVFYMSIDKTLYISKYPSDGNFKWYFPVKNTEQLDYKITNLHPISNAEVAVFSKDDVYYIQTGDVDEDGLVDYTYLKSKLQSGCKNGASVISTLDGKYIVYTTGKGLVAMTYQEMVASTEQILTYLSDAIHKTFKSFNDGPIKLKQYDFWIYCYKVGSDKMLVLDLRNGSWWPMTLPKPLSNILVLDDELVYICDRKLYSISEEYENYYDYDADGVHPVEWNCTSQKLHLDAPNYNKHISNITLTSVLNKGERMDVGLTITNYRTTSKTHELQNFDFDVDAIRSYIKKLNYSKVSEFQYTLSSTNDAIQVPLSLSSISVKYKVTGQVK